MAIDSSSIQSQAKLMAGYEVQRETAQVKQSSARYKAQQAAVATLDRSLKALGAAVKGLHGADKSMLVNAAKISKEEMVSATLAGNAKEGCYEFFVKQLASRHQVALAGFGAGMRAEGTLNINQSSSRFSVDLTLVGDSNGFVSQEKLAEAINKAGGNTGVKATVVRNGSSVTMLLTAQETGESSRFRLSAAGTENLQLRSALEDNGVSNSTGLRELSKGEDAIVYLGATDAGIELKQSTNTFKDLIDGVSLTFNKIHRSGEPPLSVEISRDTKATKDKLNEFVSAINSTLGTFDSLTAAGGESGRRGALAGDSSIRSVKNLINAELRKGFASAAGKSLIDFGVRAGADGKLKIDDKVFDKELKASPDAFDKLFQGNGQLLDSLNTKLASFISSTGSMKSRKENLDTQLQRVEEKRKDIDKKHMAHYQRYLKQFSAMAQVVASMEQTVNMLQQLDVERKK